MEPGRIEIVEHTADVALRIRAATLNELFECGARGFYQIVGELITEGPSEEHRIDLTGETPEYLLHDWLAEILYCFDVRQIVFDAFAFDVLDDHSLRARLVGRKLDVLHSQIHTEVKAVTYHELRIERQAGLLEATVVFDV